MIKLKSAELIQAIKATLPTLAKEVGSKFRDSIVSDDIVDTGKLRDSMTTVIDGSDVVFTWEVEYSTAVHEGYSRANGSLVKGRPWTKETLDQIATSTGDMIFAKDIAKRIKKNL